MQATISSIFIQKKKVVNTAAIQMHTLWKDTIEA